MIKIGSASQEIEKLTKKRFLIAFWVFHLVNCLIYLFLPGDRFWIDTIAMAMWAIPTYYFGYKKGGVKFLGLALFFIPVLFLEESGLLNFSKLLHTIEKNPQTHLPIVLYLTTGLGAVVYYWISCFSLFKLNRQLRLNKTASKFPEKQ